FALTGFVVLTLIGLWDRYEQETKELGFSGLYERWSGSASQRATSAFALSPPSDVAAAARISSASGCISRSSSDMRTWATSQPLRCIATASAAVLSLTSASAARIAAPTRAKHPFCAVSGGIGKG